MVNLFDFLAITEEEEREPIDSIFDYDEIFGSDEEEPEALEEPTEESPEDESSEEEEVEALLLDGEEVSIDEILEWKKGQLRMSDYTKKTQELKDEKLKIQQLEAQNQEANSVYNFLRSNPDLLKVLNDYAGEANITPPQINVSQEQTQPNFDPRVDELLRQSFYDKTEAQLTKIMSEGTGVTDVELLQLADELKTDVPTAYEVWKGKNIDKIISKKLQEEKLKINEDIKNNRQSTVSLMNKTKGKPQHAVLSDAEQMMAKKLDMSNDEFAKWRNYNPNNR